MASISSRPQCDNPLAPHPVDSTKWSHVSSLILSSPNFACAVCEIMTCLHFCQIFCCWQKLSCIMYVIVMTNKMKLVPLNYTLKQHKWISMQIVKYLTLLACDDCYGRLLCSPNSNFIMIAIHSFQIHAKLNETWDHWVVYDPLINQRSLKRDQCVCHYIPHRLWC